MLTRVGALTCLLALVGGTGTLAAAPQPEAALVTFLDGRGETTTPEPTTPEPTTPGPTTLEQAQPQRLVAVITRERAITPLDYEPADLVTWPGSDFTVRAEVHDQLELLFGVAEDEGLGLRVISGYRSYDTQAGTYDWWLRHHGRASADATSARPGHSEHQTGLAVDVDSTSGECYLDPCFGETDEGRWVARQAHTFGFVVSYPRGARDATGYVYEPWHLRYVGPLVATDMHARGIALLQDYASVPASSVRLGETLGSRG